MKLGLGANAQLGLLLSIYSNATGLTCEVLAPVVVVVVVVVL